MSANTPDNIVKTVELNAPIEQVWKALTDYKEFGSWFLVALDQPFEIGGKSTGRMTYPGHEQVPWLAYIESMEPQRLFSFRWYDSEDPSIAPDETQPGLLVEFELHQTPMGTRLTITESGFSKLPESRRIELMRGNQEGWNIQGENLTRYLRA